MFKVGDTVRWMCPLDADYSYGNIMEIRRSIATVRDTGYYKGTTTEVHLKYIERVQRGGVGCGSGSEKFNKRSVIKSKL